MTINWTTALVGGLIGASVAFAAVFGAASAGLFPSPSDKQFEHYLMAHPSIVIAMAEKAQINEAAESRRQAHDAITKVGLKTFFDPKLAFVTGPADAKKTFVEFFDYNCAHCRNNYPVVQKFYEQHKADTRFAFIELPIFGEASNNAARAALAARKQPDKYVDFHFAMMGEPGSIDPASMIDAAQKAGLDINKLTADVKDPAINKQLASAHALAVRIGIQGTPFFILNGEPYEGEVGDSTLEASTRN